MSDASSADARVQIAAVVRDIEMSYETLFTFLEVHQFDDEDEVDGEAAWAACRQQAEKAITDLLRLLSVERPHVEKQDREGLPGTTGQGNSLESTPRRENEQLVLAEGIARGAHLGQKEESTGDPYIHHVERVVALVDGNDTKAVAWLHDVLEDNPAWSAQRLMEAGISMRVVQAVSLLSRIPQQPYNHYIRDVQLSGDHLAIAVKLADLRDHLRPNCPARLRPRYERALKVLGVDGGSLAPPETDKPANPENEPHASSTSPRETGVVRATAPEYCPTCDGDGLRRTKLHKGACWMHGTPVIAGASSPPEREEP
jgi:hypothetical protein